MGSSNVGLAARHAAAIALLTATMGLCPARTHAATASASLSVSVSVPRRCGIRLDLDRSGQPRLRCQPGPVAVNLSDPNTQGLQYSGWIDPVSIARLPRGNGGSEVWRVTF
jgi:hypothetical protein